MNEWRNAIALRVCRSCGEQFEGKYNSSSCPECRRDAKIRAADKFSRSNPDYWKQWQKSARGKSSRRRTQLKLYGLTIQEHERLLSEQHFRCAICRSGVGAWKANGGGLVVDHDHDTGQVRGLLCPACNRGLGQFEDNPERLLNAVKYIWRAGLKSPSPIEDLMKARWYIDREIQRLEAER